MQCCSYLILFPLLSCQPSFLFFCLGIHFLFLMLMCVYIKCVYYMPSRYTEYIHGMYNIYIYIFTVQHKDSVCIIYVNDHKCVCVVSLYFFGSQSSMFCQCAFFFTGPLIVFLWFVPFLIFFHVLSLGPAHFVVVHTFMPSHCGLTPFVFHVPLFFITPFDALSFPFALLFCSILLLPLLFVLPLHTSFKC